MQFVLFYFVMFGFFVYMFTIQLLHCQKRGRYGKAMKILAVRIQVHVRDWC